MILQIKKLAIIEDGSPDNVVTLVPVTEGPEGAATLGISNEHESFFIEDRQTYVDRGNPTLEIAVLKPDSADITQLETWVNNQTDVYISAITVDGGYFFGDEETSLGIVKLVANEQLSDNDLFAVSVQRQTTPGFDPNTSLHQNGFWAGENLIGGYEWADADSDTLADGWGEDGGFISHSFSSGTQTLEADTAVRRLVRSVFFPFEGEQLTFSLNNDSRTGSYSIERVRLGYYDDSDGQISVDTTSFSSTGRKSVTGTIPANTVRVRCEFAISASSGTVTNDISDPCLRIGTGTTYTKF